LFDVAFISIFLILIVIEFINYLNFVNTKFFLVLCIIILKRLNKYYFNKHRSHNFRPRTLFLLTNSLIKITKWFLIKTKTYYICNETFSVNKLGKESDRVMRRK
jgi:hypothetical protein